MTHIQIKSRWSDRVLFECDVPADVPSGLALRHALEKAVAQRPRLVLSGTDLSDADLRGADLSGADLRVADLRGADLRGADLSGADLSGADLSGADLSGADLRGADLRGADLSGADLRDEAGEPLRATPAQAIENLDKVRAIILDNKDRLVMSDWHGAYGWQEKTCAEEAVCGTTHCLAGWLQVCATKPEIRAMHAELAGILSAPIASKMFFRGGEEVLTWLDERQYVEESKERFGPDSVGAAS